MSKTDEEIISQPDVWRQTVAHLAAVGEKLPRSGSRVAFIGCGTSYFIAQAIAMTREALGRGESDAWVASEMPVGRRYDAVVAISRSGTTTEVVRALDALPDELPTLAITAVDGTPVVAAAHDAIVLRFADEESVVQTRFATSALALLRAHLGQDLTAATAQARAALSAAPPVDPTGFEQFVFLGHGWTFGLANEAALKFREASLAWTESYFAGEYRHGPISVASARTLVWLLGVEDPPLEQHIRATGATVHPGRADAMAELVSIQRAAVALAHARGLDPDRPQHLTRSVVLP